MEPTCDTKILTEQQMSAWLGLSEPTLFRHRRDGTGPRWIQLSQRRIGYRKSDVEAWLEAHTIERVGGVELVAGGNENNS